MFGLSTKIMLVASSCHRKIGPCKNSIGYITPFNKSLMVLNKLNTITMSATVRFLRYGNEKKSRFETKHVLLAFPILRDNQNNANNQLRKFIRIINSDKHIKDCNKIRNDSKILGNVPIVMAVPIYTPWISLKSCSSREFFCWFESFLMSLQMSSFINEALVFHPFPQAKKHGITKQNLSLLQKMIVDRFIRRDVMKNIYKDTSERNKWITLLKVITITNEVCNRRKIINSLIHTLNSNLYIAKGTIIDEVYSALIPYVFYPDFSIFTNMLISFKKSDRINKEIDKIVNKIELTRTMLLKGI